MMERELMMTQRKDYIDYLRGLAASVFHFGEIDIKELKKTLAEHGINVRTEK